jgi:hypothetical protein
MAASAVAVVVQATTTARSPALAKPLAPAESPAGDAALSMTVSVTDLPVAATARPRVAAPVMRRRPPRSPTAADAGAPAAAEADDTAADESDDEATQGQAAQGQ